MNNNDFLDIMPYCKVIKSTIIMAVFLDRVFTKFRVLKRRPMTLF